MQRQTQPQHSPATQTSNHQCFGKCQCSICACPNTPSMLAATTNDYMQLIMFPWVFLDESLRSLHGLQTIYTFTIPRGLSLLGGVQSRGSSWILLQCTMPSGRLIVMDRILSRKESQAKVAVRAVQSLFFDYFFVPRRPAADGGQTTHMATSLFEIQIAPSSACDAAPVAVD